MALIACPGCVMFMAFYFSIRLFLLRKQPVHG